ncbi:hypothetical protein [Pedobacter caeni]|uniref:Outer membrane protein beta-barrel domain-containing protein n=1 Tax=Pedobacter caeni TaxID=288992 RepID=A0A1M4SYX1_9SPHI|nr:hypothetical protein [Pedobacter caeni]SHE37412.1 hypothetical protein SAMN04488522_10119 [Pedobacter caeni]
MELDDNEFDAAFRERVFDADPQFEEAAWDKMERKLRRRERIVLFRKGSVVLSLLLLIGLIGYYSFDKKPSGKARTELAGTGEKGKNTGKMAVSGDTVVVTKEASVLSKDTLVLPNGDLGIGLQSTDHNNGLQNNHLLAVKENHFFAAGSETRVNRNLSALEQHNLSITKGLLQPPAIALSLSPGSVVKEDKLIAANKDVEAASNKQNAEVQITQEKEREKLKVKPLIKKAIPMSLALSAGPEFNSAGSLIGGKGGFSAGLTFSMGIAKNFRLQTGLKYSAKDYATDSYAYRFKNPQFQGMISGIDATCAVLEIPVIASYTVMEDRQRSIDLNLGLSSYLMLKEDYTFKYTQSSGMPDRLVERRNANQHLFGVVDLSATYFIKLKTEKFKIGVEPFVKIPLTGVGEGRVNLKSSGISLKIRYDLDK